MKQFFDLCVFPFNESFETIYDKSNQFIVKLDISIQWMRKNIIECLNGNMHQAFVFQSIKYDSDDNVIMINGEKVIRIKLNKINQSQVEEFKIIDAEYKREILENKESKGYLDKYYQINYNYPQGIPIPKSIDSLNFEQQKELLKQFSEFIIIRLTNQNQ